jgi:hypothetical protein
MQQQQLIERLAAMLDLIGLAGYIGKATKWGARPSPGDAWQHTRRYLAQYATETRPEDVIALLQQAGANSDIQAARWIAKNEKSIPSPDYGSES